mgnify:CR=1 FL=1
MIDRISSILDAIENSIITKVLIKALAVGVYTLGCLYIVRGLDIHNAPYLILGCMAVLLGCWGFLRQV